MNKLLTTLFLVLVSQQAAAVTTVAGIDFIDIADTLDNSNGTYATNASGTAPGAIADGNAASWVMSSDPNATMDVSFTGAGSTPFNVVDVDLKILFVGDGVHAGTVTLLGGSAGSASQDFNFTASTANYTGYNSQTGDTLYGIFAVNMHLADAFSGTFTGLQLDVSGESAVPSLVGTVTPIPVPAAVWLFGSGLVGLAGVVRRRS